MHPRHRSPGNGYRSGSMGMNLAVASRISPESSVRSHGFHNSEYRSFNRGFGRSLSHGHPKSFQPPPPPLSRKSDIFMAAGRLAAEYLVSQGILPPSSLSGKWQNGSLKKQVGEFEEFRSPEGENLQFPGEMRTSALARLGNSGFDSGSGRRRYSDDYNAVGMRNHVKGRRRGGSFRGYGSDWGRDYGRNGSWSDRRRVSPEMGVEHAADAGHKEEKIVAKDNADAVEKTSTSSVLPKSNKDGGDSDSEVKEHLSKANSSSPVKDRFVEAGGELSKESRESRNSTERNEEIKDGSNNHETGKKIVAEELPAETAAAEIKLAGSSIPDLRALCKFANVPTRIRSSRGNKLEPVSGGVGSNEATGPSRGTRVLVEDDTIVDSSNTGSASDYNESKCLDSEISKATSLHPSEALEELAPARGTELAEHVSSQPLPEVKELSPACGFDKAKGSKSESFPDRSLDFENDRDSSQGLPGCETLNNVVEKRVKKLAVEESDVNEGRKRTREWLSPIANEGDKYFHPSKLSKSKADIKGDLMSAEKVVTVADPDNSASNSLLLEVEDTTCANSQEKQLFPSSFKICDLNLMETSDVNENHDQAPIFMYPPILDLKAENSSVDVDLSISNAGTSSENVRRMPNGRAIDVIDLENDTALEDKAFNMPERKTETAFTGLEGFPNPAPNAVDIPDAQDGYGLMISELLGNDFANCTSVQGEINALDNIGLHNGEVPLGEDDPIYMSLGEIPFLSFFRNWENAPPQEDGKPF
ncbi:uncharacterized protein At4g26450 [Rhodamnia argentea]|uniref:Uncharacterized protein At4g26450 n=1 Tax=Rhodamnia argentea TaxID=178133 RepID=A0A8B8QRA7_9MYRT|nr:uncharacterized protein At4g26450 [Rhodamnia argentea]